MADEAFALSPISARAAQPSEQDYDAIREAFMETSRGRWFLGEYAKRNRNADTRMVLDAVAKIEETLEAQRQPVVIDRTPEVLDAVRKVLAEAQEAAAAAFDTASAVQHLGPIHRGVRIIKEISWRWREIGGDSRICDLIDSELLAIEGACELLSAMDPRDELEAAFDLIKRGLAQVEVGEARPAQPAAPKPAQEAPVEATAAASPAPSETVERPPAAPGPCEPEPEVDLAGTDDLELTLAAEPVEAMELLADDADAQDEAILDMVAFEMAAPDPEFDEDMAGEGLAAPSAVADPTLEPVATQPTAVTEMAEMTTVTMASPEVTQAAPLPASSLAFLPEPSLGATIIASGILQKPRTAANDPLAPIRRMTQAEKIAFFS
ncbi:MAG: hypothetical protein HY852_22860 [Bradyrhizobium sp.]|uniref:hypothetical protein n=1 Tax=Bradyrhizobium sp. TaxID=376 RepID=UPI0025B7C991|nr:hypothetical protein [Bradyrhizobium sp.]MBI5264646.1 hypothetical protein [Bradyrhizobium sp.]